VQHSRIFGRADSDIVDRLVRKANVLTNRFRHLWLCDTHISLVPYSSEAPASDPESILNTVPTEAKSARRIENRATQVLVLLDRVRFALEFEVFVSNELSLHTHQTLNARTSLGFFWCTMASMLTLIVEMPWKHFR
jgi:hypothetical protein